MAIGDILRIGARTQLDIWTTEHSLRRGLVTESSRAGDPDAVAGKQGGWAPGSTVIRRCREDDEAFTENALDGCCDLRGTAFHPEVHQPPVTYVTRSV
ncbi:hypothetical protein AB0G81_31690 [Streptomyces asoensis]|uniref:hypothetical protein n=1 Tax=Streptomyces asoensis TaxID=249586 RepID=UPI00340E645A